MAISEEIASNLIEQISTINLWIKGLGIAALVWIVYTGVMFWIEKKKMDKISNVEKIVQRLEKKVDRING